MKQRENWVVLTAHHAWLVIVLVLALVSVGSAASLSAAKARSKEPKGRLYGSRTTPGNYRWGSLS